jgi:penicillin-binding protein 1A
LALESGYAPNTTLDGLDEPIATAQGPWLPAGEHESSSVRLRDALVLSSNRAAAHLLKQVGITRTVDLVHRFGVTSELPNVPSLALGTGEMSLFELTSAYSVFANRGLWRQPTLIRRVLDRYGREIYRAPNRERPVISEATAYLMTSMMADVIDRGTAATARTHGVRFSAAGKTGTSQSYADAWFVGYTPKLVTGVWFGYDQPQTIMNRGFASVIAVPAWARFMAAAHQGLKNEWFVMPGSLTKVKLCRLSGQLATDRCHLPVIEAPT